MQHFDVFVLGTGPAGGSIAAGLAHAGLRVGVCDDPVGGTCALRGCNPKKVLVAQADLVARARRLAGRGVATASIGLDWRDLVQFERTFTDPVPEATTRGLRKAGATVLEGLARFEGPQALTVGDASVEADHVVIATGAEPVPLPFEGAEHIATSADFFALEDVPPRVVFVGAGYVAAELAGALWAAGRSVTLFERSDRILPVFDEAHAARLVEMLRESGVDVRLEHTVSRVEKTGEEFVVHAQHGEEDIAVECDLVVHGAGRRPRLARLGLDAAGIDHDDRRGVLVDDDLRSTSNHQVFAAGDCAATDRWPLTPAAEHEARVVRAAILEGGAERPPAPILPTVAFTLPPIARVGMTASEAEEAGRNLRVEEGDTDRWGSVRKYGGAGGAYRVVVDADSDAILGAHLLGPGAEETINLFALAMEAGMSASRLGRLAFAFPTFASDVGNML